MKRLFLSFKFRNILFIKIWKNSKKIISFFLLVQFCPSRLIYTLQRPLEVAICYEDVTKITSKVFNLRNICLNHDPEHNRFL